MSDRTEQDAYLTLARHFGQDAMGKNVADLAHMAVMRMKQAEERRAESDAREADLRAKIYTLRTALRQEATRYYATWLNDVEVIAACADHFVEAVVGPCDQEDDDC